MKTAIKYAIAFDIGCPYCDHGFIDNPQGISNWTKQELEACEGKIVKCEECGKESLLPKAGPR